MIRVSGKRNRHIIWGNFSILLTNIKQTKEIRVGQCKEDLNNTISLLNENANFSQVCFVLFLKIHIFFPHTWETCLGIVFYLDAFSVNIAHASFTFLLFPFLLLKIQQDEYMLLICSNCLFLSAAFGNLSLFLVFFSFYYHESFLWNSFPSFILIDVN